MSINKAIREAEIKARSARYDESMQWFEAAPNKPELAKLLQTELNAMNDATVQLSHDVVEMVAKRVADLVKDNGGPPTYTNIIVQSVTTAAIMGAALEVLLSEPLNSQRTILQAMADMCSLHSLAGRISKLSEKFEPQPKSV